MNFCRTAIVAFCGLLCLSTGGCSQPPTTGVISFKPFSGFPPTDSMTGWLKKHKHAVVVTFRGPPGRYALYGFMLKRSEQDPSMVYCYRQHGNSNWEIMFDPTKNILNMFEINQVAGDFEIELLFMVDSPPSTEYALDYETKSVPKNTYKIVKAALPAEK
jgi:hypothetical protein